LGFFRFSDHLVQLLDSSDTLGRLLEETLSNVGHDSLVLSDLRRDANERAELRRQVNILTLLTDFEQGLVDLENLLVISRLEVVNHIGSRLLVSMVKDIVLGVHVPLDGMHLVGSVGAVVGHHDCSFEFTVHEMLVILPLLQTVLDQCQAVVNRKELGNIVDDQIQTSLEDPRRGEEPRPGLYLLLEHLGFGWHEEARVATDLPQVGVTEAVFNDAVDEAEGDRMVFHF